MYNSYKISEWEDLSRDELYACLRLRIDVFVVEQDCPYPELDGKDQYSLHLFSENLDISMGNSVKAYLRIVKPGVSYNEPSIGRVAIAKSIRGNGLGKEIMKKALDQVECVMVVICYGCASIYTVISLFMVVSRTPPYDLMSSLNKCSA